MKQHLLSFLFLLLLTESSRSSHAHKDDRRRHASTATTTSFEPPPAPQTDKHAFNYSRTIAHKMEKVLEKEFADDDLDEEKYHNEKEEELLKLERESGGVREGSESVMKKSRKKAGMPTGPKRSLALGRVAVSMLFSAYGATTRKSFNKLPLDVRHRLVMCVCMHTACMRFQLVRELHKEGELRWSQPSNMYIMASDWNKMRREVGKYSVKFPMEPRFKAME